MNTPRDENDSLIDPSERTSETVPTDEDKSCMSPRFILGLFTFVNFITYYDRGVMSACLSDVRSDPTITGDGPTISDTKGGFIVSAFMVGFMLTCPIFASLGGRFTAKQIIIAGMLFWALACIASGLSHGYGMILVARMFVGVGEAAYAGYTVTIIDNIAPKEGRTRWIGTFYSMIPVGTAIGMACGGVIAADGGIGSIPGWRVAFITEVIAAAPIILCVCFMPNKYNPKVTKPSDVVAGGNDSNTHVDLKTAAFILITNVRYVLIVFGYAMYVFVTGAIAVWAISMLTQGPLNLSSVSASLLMGGATALTGVFGSIAGGLFVDKLGGSQGHLGAMKCQLFDAAMMVISVPCGLVALTAESVPLFLIFFVISVFALFAVTAPVNASILTVVPMNIRTYAISFSVFSIHLMGDFPSPTVAGSLSDRFSDGCNGINVNTTCIAAEASNHCRWVPPKDHEDGSCVNIYQLRNALVIVYCMLLLAIPAWLVVWVLERRELQKEQSGTMVDDRLISSDDHQTPKRIGAVNSDIESLKSDGRFAK